MPIVAVPLFAEQPLNAVRIEAVDAGVVVPPGDHLAARIETAVRAVSTDPPAGAARMAQATAGHADVGVAVSVAEELVRNTTAAGVPHQL